MTYNLIAARQAIIIECRKLGLDDDARHDLIRNVGHVASGSTRDMNADACRRVLDHLRRAGPRPNEWTWVDTAAPARRPLLRKLIVLAGPRGAGIARGRQIAYIEGIASQMAGGDVIKPLRMCDERELHKIVQALAIHVERRRV